MDTKESIYRGEAHDSESFAAEDEGLVSGIRRPAVEKKSRIMARLISWLLLFSLGLNLVQLVHIAVRRPQCLSLYAKIPENEINIPFHYATEYSTDEHDDEAKDALWNAIDISEGFVALTHQESDSLGLPRSKTFPWDINKGMYVSHGHHALHCTTLLHAFTYDSHRGKKPLVSYHHVEHCLDLIRQDIICHADDFMDFTAGHGDEFLTGDNQPRMCRDWNKLSEWVKQRSSCYKTVNITRAGEDHGVEHQLDRYTHCPEGSPYIPVIDAWRDLNRPNPGNLAGDGVEAQTEAEVEADAEAVSDHNSDIQAT